MTEPQRPHRDSLIDVAALGDGLQETAWIEVIRKMDEVYSDLIRYEVDLERKNAALAQAQQFISSIIASMSDILVVCDHKGLIQQVNPALLGLTGFVLDELLGQPLTVLMREPDARLFHPGAIVEHEAQLRSIAGWTDHVAMNCSPRLDRQRRLPGMVIVGRPVGELKRAYEALNAAHSDLKMAQQQLIQAEKMASIGRLVAGVAHELNNPISFVYGNSHTLARYRERLAAYLDAIHGGADVEQREALRKSLKIDALMADLGPLIDGTFEGAQRVSEIVKNLRRLSFVNPSERQRVNLAELMRNALQWVLKSAKQRITVADSLPDELWVLGLEGPLHQVFVNLAQNAADALEGRPDAALSLSGRLDEGRVVVSLRDNGPGIPTAQLLKVFDPFYTTKPVGKGTGLGLWVTWSILRDHGGSIEAANGDAGGAEFTVTLPGG
jgi:two-component system sensor histidine kinase HupT/HoxJ